MQLKHLAPLALAGAVTGQSLSDVLAAQSGKLSALTGLLASNQTIYNVFANAQNVTLLAPSNDAITAFSASPMAAMLNETDFLAALLSYHVLAGTFYASNLSSPPNQQIPTLLTIPRYSNVTGAQRVVSKVDGNAVTFTSGNGASSTVQEANLNFTGGTVHIIDKVLTIPTSLSDTLVAANLSTLVGAVKQAGLVDTLNQAADVTVLAPKDAAFDAISSLVANLSVADLTAVLGYHVITGSAIYSNDIKDGAKVKSLQGTELTFRVVDGNVFVNGAKVVQANLLANNGVVHVIDTVLNPASPSAAPNVTAATTSPAPTSTGGVVTAGAPMQTAALGLAVLFGGVGIMAL
ncbi:FAS1 domain-containing protein [Podospora didyma]|uniref:FAS1 domain-containing protein n=1 Tax=Podospora didyma TaxID=330526 RepID=A0AAE0NTG9_9PEZI|nr:FAS1 domain-containing protein [Podospora didyma]